MGKCQTMKIRGKNYTNQEIEFLRNNYLTSPYIDIAKQLNRPLSSIYFKCSKLNFKKHKKKEIDNIELTPSFAYFIGCLCGDASIMNNKIRLCCMDEDFADEFYKHCKIMLSKSNINVTKYSSNRTYYIQISSLGLKEYIIKHYGIFKTFNWKIPKEIMNSNDKNITRYFLKGYFDSEGNIRKYDIRLQCVCDSLKKVSSLFNLLNIKNRYHLVNRRTITGSKVYSISITGSDNLNKFKELIGCSIQRKNAWI